MLAREKRVHCTRPGAQHTWKRDLRGACTLATRFSRCFCAPATHHLSSFFGAARLRTVQVVQPLRLDEILLEDECVYSREELKEMLDMIHEGNKLQVATACAPCRILGATP